MTDEQAALIARIEATTGADMELNHNIATGVGWKKKPSGHGWSAPDNDKYHADYPSFTKSLDAALTLVPDGAEICWAMRFVAGEKPEVWVWNEYAAPGQSPNSAGATLALALCLAALRARWA